MGDFAKSGDKVRFLDANGYDTDLKRAREQFTKNQVLKVADAHIGDWNSTYRFESVPGWFNTVMFELVKDEAPVAESQPGIEIFAKASLIKDEVIDRAVATFNNAFTGIPLPDDGEGQNFRDAMTAVVDEVRKITLDSLLLDAEALDGARHLMLWLDGHTRPTDRSLLTHCRLLGKKPPEECLDVDHVSPKSLRTYWILKAIVDEHRRLCAK